MNQVCLALLRGINVTGYKIIKMADLTELFKSLGHTQVSTYIQSGNVVFLPSPTSNPETISVQIEQAIKERVQFEVSVLVFSSLEWQDILLNNPFNQPEIIPPEKVYLTLLAEVPDQEKKVRLKEINFPPEEFQHIGRAVYVYCANGYGNTKLTNLLFEKQLKTVATTRNWRTANKLMEMMQQ